MASADLSEIVIAVSDGLILGVLLPNCDRRVHDRGGQHMGRAEWQLFKYCHLPIPSVSRDNDWFSHPGWTVVSRRDLPVPASLAHSEQFVSEGASVRRSHPELVNHLREGLCGRTSHSARDRSIAQTAPPTLADLIAATCIVYCHSYSYYSMSLLIINHITTIILYHKFIYN